MVMWIHSYLSFLAYRFNCQHYWSKRKSIVKAMSNIIIMVRPNEFNTYTKSWNVDFLFFLWIFLLYRWEYFDQVIWLFLKAITLNRRTRFFSNSGPNVVLLLRIFWSSVNVAVMFLVPLVVLISLDCHKRSHKMRGLNNKKSTFLLII